MQETGSASKNCADCGKPLSQVVMASGLTRCTPCSAERLRSAHGPAQAHILGGGPDVGHKPTAATGKGRIRGFLHLAGTIVAWYVLWFVASLVVNAAGVDYQDSFAWGLLVASPVFFVYWARRIPSWWTKWWFVILICAESAFAIWWALDTVAY